MHRSSDVLVFNRLYDLYRFLELPTEQIDEQSEFDSHRLSRIHTTLPFQSPVFQTSLRLCLSKTQLARIDAYLKASVDAPMTLQIMASLANLSVFHFSGSLSEQPGDRRMGT